MLQYHLRQNVPQKTENEDKGIAYFEMVHSCYVNNLNLWVFEIVVFN